MQIWPLITARFLFQKRYNMCYNITCIIRESFFHYLLLYLGYCKWPRLPKSNKICCGICGTRCQLRMQISSKLNEDSFGRQSHFWPLLLIAPIFWYFGNRYKVPGPVFGDDCSPGRVLTSRLALCCGDWNWLSYSQILVSNHNQLVIVWSDFWFSFLVDSYEDPFVTEACTRSGV